MVDYKEGRKGKDVRKDKKRWEREPVPVSNAAQPESVKDLSGPSAVEKMSKKTESPKPEGAA